MQFTDSLYKDKTPIETVDCIQNILNNINIELQEIWNNSGVDFCHSLNVFASDGVPSSNGKGVTKDFARASAYGEMIERIQGGLFLYKYQSIIRNPEMNVHAYAPDGKYMTIQELIENGEWMDYLIKAYPSPFASRENIAEHCKAYACADDGRILTLPFYSLFENKYVYLPIAFVDQIYATNGCCAGNTREEAWVHAFSEMMERHASLKMLRSGKAAPKIPEDKLNKFPLVAKILNQIRELGEYNVDVFDYSIGNGFPVVSTRIISKKTHSYRVNVAADPIFEIAVQRTLTELFQGKTLDSVTKKHNGQILRIVSDYPTIPNVINQLETSSGLYTADFFANELTCEREPADYPDNSGKNNKQLLDYMLDLYRQLGKPVYIRNFSYLGFPSYRFVVPGFSEAFAVRLEEIVPEYAIADEVSKTLRNVKSASDDDINWMLSYSNTIRGIIGRYNFFGRIAGIPLTGGSNSLLASITRAYAAYRLNRYMDAIDYMSPYIKSCSNEEMKGYFECVNRYLQMKSDKIADEKIRVILYKFFESRFADLLYANLDQGKTPYDDYLISCDYTHCENCRYADSCSYNSIKEMNKRVGAVYNKFVNGQDPSEFAI